jgi:hypothetical protein
MKKGSGGRKSNHGGEPVAVEEQVHRAVVAVQDLGGELGQVADEPGNLVDGVPSLGECAGGLGVERVRAACRNAGLGDVGATVDSCGQVGDVDGARGELVSMGSPAWLRNSPATHIR